MLFLHIVLFVLTSNQIAELSQVKSIEESLCFAEKVALKQKHDNLLLIKWKPLSALKLDSFSCTYCDI